METSAFLRSTPFEGLRFSPDPAQNVLIFNFPKEAAVKKEAKKKDQAIHQTVAEKAYELHEKRGSRHGHDLEDWLEAERWVLSEKKADAPAQKSLRGILRSKTGL